MELSQVLRRLQKYFQEMYPIGSRLSQSFGLFLVVYLLVLLNSDVREITIGLDELIVAITIFGFLLAIRITDELKDFETDKKHFPDRPLVTGEVKKSDIRVLLATDLVVILLLNMLFLNNYGYFLLLIGYAVAMSVWFGLRKLIQPRLPLALITHNPVQILLILYVVSFVAYKYGLEIYSLNNVLIIIGFYLSALIWELGRKIRAPEDETKYVTYSSIFGFKNAIYIVLGVAIVQLVIFESLVQSLPNIISLLLLVNGAALVVVSRTYIKRSRAGFVKVTTAYVILSSLVLLLAVIAKLYERIEFG